MLKKHEEINSGINDLPSREGKRKAAVNYSPNEAQMANAVQSIANGARGSGQSFGKAHINFGSPKAILSQSVRGKKGIARSRVSLTSEKKLAAHSVDLEAPTSAMASFLDINPNQTFNFKAISSGQPVDRGLDKGMMAEQTDMEVRNSAKKVGENNGGISCSKVTSVVTDMPVEVQCQDGLEPSDLG